MGIRASISDVILKISKIKYWIIFFVVIVVIIEVALFYIHIFEQRNTWKSISSILRNEVNSSNSYQVARILSDMEVEGWIKCVKLIETTNDLRIFYDTTTQSSCGRFSSPVNGELQAINGSKWNLSFSTSENIWLYVIRIIIPIFIFFGEAAFFRHFSHQRKLQEAIKLRMRLEKDFLLDIAKRTKHDVASPIGALKIVIAHLDIPVEYSEMLGSITERIDKIFNDLKSAENDFTFDAGLILENVDIGRSIVAIVREKIKEHKLPENSISFPVVSHLVVGQPVEIERIFSNILNNSVEAKRTGAPLSIDISLSETDQYILVNIEDNGIGIDSDNIQKIGLKGFSVGKSLKSNSGIGLYNAKRLMQAFGGDFYISSKKCSGTTVKLRFRKAGSVE